ncbi:GNAT family N-acetyltransferase [Klebsiella sp. BIGb0407]|uniref:GNAT family N-acetyltransferase n=1 Tax=Klebsiella sp. BIGb0407 TaxID=2940603 RepID=UPI0021683121|nr:GNAT family N-acetyltransferase [Klebsiella sp. BIGb0407]MCS3433722.1 GNAT superfamily N-acetyltransferase [Klebsiella sp. BIGb0407]
MLKIIPLDSERTALFAQVDGLYESAFPLHEKRCHAAKIRALNHANYQLQAWFDAEMFIGMIGMWDFGDYRYIEHLAVNDTLRGQGYGKRMLNQFLLQSPLTILEIDPLTTEIARKRLRFYQSLGFQVNHYSHTHPTYHENLADHQLIVLSYPQQIDSQQYQRFLNDLRHEVMADSTNV